STAIEHPNSRLQRTFENWNAMGCKFARVAGGGKSSTTAHIRIYGVRSLSPLTPLSSLPPLPLPLPHSASPNTPVIVTSYDPQHPINKHYPAPRERDRESNIAWTEHERSRASKAVEPTSIQDLESQLESMYVSGKRTSVDSYVRVPVHLIQDALTIRGVDNSLIACIWTSIPEVLRRDLIDGIAACFETDPFKTMVAESMDGRETFQVLHFSWYNRHCTQGHSAPSHIPPSLMSRKGCSRTNHDQFLPYTSKDMEEHRDIYEAIKKILGPLRETLPLEFERLEATASFLPDNNTSAVHPFVGLVVNLNVVTRAHRDGKDDQVCLVLPIGDFVGGELCLVEAGLVIPLRHADFVVFPSCEFTHFNLLYTG
ncbi:uncharacterized protein B0H18DRAFT_860839, partial [Fomitopsis serialis]|uniref:uncharacterized protein n=1 Tax=Fomitopsis serialis TaxID=139415 RepID=UPI0020075456